MSEPNEELCDSCGETFDPSDSDATAFAHFCSAECEQDNDDRDEDREAD